MKERERTGRIAPSNSCLHPYENHTTENRIMTPHAAKLEPAALQNYAKFFKNAHTFHGSNCKQTRKEKKACLN
jgi:hypothetical protein